MQKNSKHSRKLGVFLIVMSLCILCISTQVFALTTSDVEAAVSGSSKESVAGNVFIWFLCAIAFLKISQKIDSVMATLGINVGRTGGSMLGELMMASRFITGGKNFAGSLLGGGNGGGGNGLPGAGTKFLSGGLSGAVGRHIDKSAVANATGNGGGIVGSKAFQSSLAKNGDYANDIIGQVAKGNISKNGSITGDNAAAALSSYMGFGDETAETGVDAALSTGEVPTITTLDSADISIPGSISMGDTSSTEADNFSSEPSMMPLVMLPTGESIPSQYSDLSGMPTIDKRTHEPADISSMTTSAGIPLVAPASSSASIPFSEPIGAGSGSDIVSNRMPSTEESPFVGAEFADGIESTPTGSSMPLSSEGVPSVAAHATFADELDSYEDNQMSHPTPVTPIISTPSILAGADSETLGYAPRIAPTGATPDQYLGTQIQAASVASIAQSSSEISTPHQSILKFSGVEIGGGRITGTETSSVYPTGKQFAMYSTDQYVKPEGDHNTIKAKDGSTWYKQYAVPAVEKIPFKNDKGKIEYNEKIVDKLPRNPQRKDRS